MADFTMRPHSFVVSSLSVGANLVPPVSTPVEILSGVCNNQTGNSGSIKSEADVMQYDYVLFHDEEIVEEINPGDIIVVNHLGKTITGEVKKSLPGQLSNRIWYNETANG